MPNSRYRKGYKKENKIVNDFKKEGYDICFRSAGSHSPVDVVVINKETKTIKLIQSKKEDFSEFQTKKLLENNNWLNNNFKVEFVVM